MPDAPVWEDIRRDYDDLGLSLRDIYTKYGIDKSDFNKRRRDEFWPPRPTATDMHDVLALRRAAKLPADVAELTERPPPAPEPAHSEDPPPRKPPSRKRRATSVSQRRQLVERITRAIDIKLQVLERRFEAEMGAKAKYASSADTERDMRAIAQLIKNLEQVAAYAHAPDPKPAIHGAAAKSAADAAVASRHLADEADRVRRELGERIRRFVDAAKAVP